MAQNPEDIRKKVQAAEVLLAGNSTTLGKLKSAATLLTGVNPTIDALLGECTKQISTWEKIEDGAVIELSAEQLPENTEEEKKRKRMLLLFIRTFKDLRNEVVRVQSEMVMRSSGESVESPSMWARIFGAAKGPLGLVTVVAVAIAAMSATSVNVSIENDGCSALETNSSIPLSIPGLSLPSEPIADGGSAVATIPPLSFEVDGTSGSALTLSSIGLDLTIELSSSIRDVTFDGQSLIGKSTTIRLSDADTHALVISCS